MKPIHPIADIFPLISETELAVLADDILENGLRQAITLHSDGSVLDGRNRDLACVIAHVEPRYVVWNGHGTPEAFVISMNLHRRHLKESQRGMIAARLATAKAGQRSDLGEISPRSHTAREAAELLNVNRATVISAKTVLREGTSEEVRDLPGAATAPSL